MKLTRDDLLVLLIEECGEVIQAATKCLRFGYDVDHGTGYGNNRDALAKELGELTAVRDELDIDCTSAFMTGWADKIKRAEAVKEKYGVTHPSS
jgi:NTP pyrophosphatase (non-canonical NTP hydrolase)